MNITNKDIPVKGYFPACLFERMEKSRTKLGESRSSYMANAVDAWIEYGRNHISVPMGINRPKLVPNRRAAPRIHLRQ